MPIEVYGENIGVFIAIARASDFKYQRSKLGKRRSIFSFSVDWTSGGEGLEILRGSMREETSLKVRHQGREYSGLPVFSSGMNDSDGIVVFFETS